jgi:4-amino-4-deoxy-L-arabinose transferase
MDLTRIISTHFTNEQLLFIITGLIAGLMSFILFTSNKISLSILFLFISGLILRLFAAGLDPFVNIWDEQFHALVAKNMMDHPFRPTLYNNPILDYDYTNWGGNHIWLHKQPWFLWQITLFFSLFGVNEFVLRLPSVIMLSLLILMIYRIGTLITTRRIAWYGVFLYTYSMLYILLITGQYFTDHNDAAFLFYIAASIWAWLEYTRSGKLKWVVWVGIFAGIAILNKWLVGLLVYSGWFVSVLTISGTLGKWRELKRIGLALLLTTLVALPWQIYTMKAFPAESSYEYAYNTEHFFKALEGHDGNVWYHFLLVSHHYGSVLVLFVIVPGLVLLFGGISRKGVRAAMITIVITTYLFFTLAATKMPLFVTIVMPVMFLGLAAVLDKVIDTVSGWLPARLVPFLLVPLLVYMSYTNLSVHNMDLWHTDQHLVWRKMRMNTLICKQAAGRLPSKDYVIFNTGGYNAIMFMFYTGYTTYGFYPTPEHMKMLKDRNIPVAVFADENIPGYLRDDPEVIRFYYPVFRY